MPTRAVLRCLAAAVLFGLSAPAAARLTGDMGAVTLAGLLYVGAGLAVAPLVVSRPPSRSALRRSARSLSLAVFLGGALGPILLVIGLGLVPAATASLLLNLELVFTMLVAGLVFREHLGRHLLTGTAFVVAAGVVLVASADADLRWGGLVIAAACLCWAFDNSITASLDHLQPSAITLAKGAVAGSANLALGLALDGGWPAAGPVCAALAIGALGYGVSITLWVTGARDLGAARAQLVFATAPFVGAIAAWAIGDSITARELVAFALGAVGVAFVLRSGHDHTHHHHAMSHGHEHVHDDGHHDHFHDEAIAPGTRHTHEHEHAPRVHSHPHVPDLHHRHDH